MGWLDFLFRRKKKEAAPPLPQFTAASEDRTMFGIPGPAAVPRTPAAGPSPDATMFGIPGQATPSAPAPSPAAPPPQAPAPSALSADATQYVSAAAAPPSPEAPTEAATVAIKAPPRPRARISIRQGGSGGPWELMEREYAVGRSTSGDIVLADASVSGRHARLVPHGDGFAIRDLGSTNGTKVNGQVVSGDRELRSGDTITLGEAVLAYERM